MGLEIEVPETMVDVPLEVLQTYVGTYELMTGFNVEVTVEDNQLFAQGTGQPKIKIIPKSEHVFYSKEAPPILTFNADEEGDIISLTVSQQGQTFTGKKIK